MSGESVSQSLVKKTHPEQKVRHLKSLIQTDLKGALGSKLNDNKS